MASNIDRQIEFHKDMLSDLIEQKAELERFGEEPEVGSVIYFEKTFDNGRRWYTYCAFRAHGKLNGWYLTGQSSVGKSWDSIREFMLTDTRNSYIATEWVEYP